MALNKRYDAQTEEPQLLAWWTDNEVYHFNPDSPAPVYAVDTPPPSVSGNLHLGHLYSYAHADFFARFRRMRGDNVFYPMGYDDNGLPTERLVERESGIRAAEIGRQAFIDECLRVGATVEQQYEDLWRRFGLSVDWRYTYRTIDRESQRIAQWGFLDLVRKDLAYRKLSPTIWCPECGTAIAQAELNDMERETTFYSLAFGLEDGQLLIATTRPELLPACVAVFVHPADDRYRHLIGREATIPILERRVPILADTGADPAKGTGVVMCCTFGDMADVAWWRAYDLPLIEAIGRDGRMTASADPYAGLSILEARRAIVADLSACSLLAGQQPLSQSVRVHERCDTAVEYITSLQWFIRILDQKEEFLQAGEQIAWHPEHMRTRYRQWVENLNWDWCISRQRYFGVPFPIWYCAACGEPMYPDDSELPVDPSYEQPSRPCSCGSSEFLPETDVMDTWATSSLTPQIIGQMFTAPALYRQVFPMTMRPQAHEIIRTWAFYTIVRSLYHTGLLPWQSVAISGWALAAEGEMKLSKSRGGGAVGPLEMLERFSADAVRYWAAGTALGKDAVINELRIQAGVKWSTKLWNVARFSERFLTGYTPITMPADLTPADRWLLARLGEVIATVTRAFENYDYVTSKNEIEEFFWRDLADNYLEMAKKRLYDGGIGFDGAQFTLYTALLATIKMIAPLMPFIAEAVYQGLFRDSEGGESIHRATWPVVDERFLNDSALATGATLLDITTAVRRYKSERNLSLGEELAELQIAITDPAMHATIQSAALDLISITRAQAITIVETPADKEEWLTEGTVAIRIIP